MASHRIFVGSSVEGLDYAYAVKERLDRHAQVTVWDQGIFKPTKFLLESLLAALNRFDCAVFVFSPDDITNIRGEEYGAPRDNVVFEMGLFVGHLGRDRSFIIVPAGAESLRLPTDLLGVSVLTYLPAQGVEEPSAAFGTACHKISQHLRELPVLPEETEALPKAREIDRKEFSKILLSRLEDPKINTVKMVTYTAEVDAGLFHKWHVSKGKKIEVFKRSILRDLAEQQECNLRRLVRGSRVRRWNKRRDSIGASERLAKNQDIQLVQHLYDAPPTRRAYVFDDQEALVCWYEVTDEESGEGGSVYQGMTDGPAISITTKEAGDHYLFVELEHFFESLRRVSRSWEEERDILLDGGPWRGGGRRPCIEPRAVFLDVDGVLLNSLPLYVRAWREAFAVVEVKFDEVSVYQEEGRRGVETIRDRLREASIRQPTEAMVKAIQEKKREVLRAIGPAPAQEGAEELLDRMRELGVEIWAITGSSDEEIPGRLKDLFPQAICESRVITARDVYAGKPNPAPYLVGCLRAGIEPHYGVAIENAPLGVSAAEGAGLFCIAVNTGILEDAELLKAGARVVFDSVSDLAEKWSEVIEILSE